MKFINLLPQEYKQNMLVGQLKKIGIIAIAIPVIYLTYIQGSTMIMKSELKELQGKVNEVAMLKSGIENKKVLIKEREQFLQNIDQERFPFYNFMYFITMETPEDLNLISLDTTDRLVKAEEEVTVDGEVAEKTPEEILVEQVPTENPTEEVVFEVENLVESLERQGIDIVIRGYSRSNTAIAEFVYNISLLDYVEGVNLNSIEEKYTPDNTHANVFELIVSIK